VAVSVAGMACDAAFTQERLIAIGAGETTRVGPWWVTLDGLSPVVAENWSALQARLAVRRGERDDPVYLYPQSRTFANPPTVTSESAILTVADGQLYTVLGAPGDHGRWQVRLWWKPFVTLIWLGGVLIALGGAVSLVGRIMPRRRARAGMEAWL
jgi:cytochrome c-type biogenesis protein CcmF